MITVIMSTYMPDEARLICARNVVQGLKAYLKSSEDLVLHIADDGSPKDLFDRLHEVARCYFPLTSTIANRKGIGGSLNLALNSFLGNTSNKWFYITDDWYLKKPLDLDIASKLISLHGYDYVRLGPIHPDLKCAVRYETDCEYFLELFPGEGGFCFATRPFLAHRDFYTRVGPFVEGKDAYDTERLYAQACVDKRSFIKMAFVGDLDPRGTWEHIGDVSPVGHIQPVAHV